MESFVLAQGIVHFAREDVALGGARGGKLFGSVLRAVRSQGQGCAFGG
jgi:hypothetical protein